MRPSRPLRRRKTIAPGLHRCRLHKAIMQSACDLRNQTLLSPALASAPGRERSLWLAVLLAVRASARLRTPSWHKDGAEWTVCRAIDAITNGLQKQQVGRPDDATSRVKFSDGAINEEHDLIDLRPFQRLCHP